MKSAAGYHWENQPIIGQRGSILGVFRLITGNFVRRLALQSADFALKQIGVASGGPVPKSDLELLLSKVEKG